MTITILIITRTQHKQYSNISTPNNSPTHSSQIRQILLLLLQFLFIALLLLVSHILSQSPSQFFLVCSSSFVYIHKNTDQLTFTSLFSLSACNKNLVFSSTIFVFSTAVLSNSKLQALAAGDTSVRSAFGIKLLKGITISRRFGKSENINSLLNYIYFFPKFYA